MNHDHGEELVRIARVLGGRPEATAASAEAVDRFGVDLRVETPSGPASARVDFAEPIPEDHYPDGVRVAFVRLARRARNDAPS
ncbi:MAG: DUF2470 domain-containing protein [Ilumatobacteraceae bacterium]